MSTALIVEGYHYTAHDARATITNLGAWWAQLLSGRGPVPEVDGLLAEQVALLAHALHRPSPSAAATAGAIEAVGELGREAYVAIGDGRVDPALLLGPSLRLLDRAVDALRAAGRLPARATGSVVQLNVSDGGVPKRPVESVDIDERGVDGDRQAGTPPPRSPLAGPEPVVGRGDRCLRRRRPPHQLRALRGEHHGARAALGRTCAAVSAWPSARSWRRSRCSPCRAPRTPNGSPTGTSPTCTTSGGRSAGCMPASSQAVRSASAIPSCSNRDAADLRRRAGAGERRRGSGSRSTTRTSPTSWPVSHP